MSFERQERLGLKRDQSVAVVGCGGVGSWVALYLTMAGVERIDLFDGDTVDGTNLNRMPVPASTIGQHKTDTLAHLIRHLRPAQADSIYPHGKFIPKLAAALGVPWDWLVVSTDTLSSRKEAFAYANKHRIKYIEAAANGLAGSVAASPAEWDLEKGDPAGYRAVPVFVGPCAAAAAMASYYVLHYRVPTKVHRIDWSDDGLKLTETSDE